MRRIDLESSGRQEKIKKFLTNTKEFAKIKRLPLMNKQFRQLKNNDNWTVKNLERFKENNSSNQKIDERFDLIEDL